MGRGARLAAVTLCALAGVSITCSFDKSGFAPTGQFEGCFRSSQARLSLTSPDLDLLSGDLCRLAIENGATVLDRLGLDGRAENSILAILDGTRPAGDTVRVVVLRDATNDTLTFQIGDEAPSTPLARPAPNVICACPALPVFTQ